MGALSWRFPPREEESKHGAGPQLSDDREAGSEGALAAALQTLESAVPGIAGSQGAMVLQDRKEPQKFLFLEFWDSEESRKAAGSQLPKEVMGQIMAALGGPLQMADYDRVAG